jgi:hypothetical protein
MSTTHSAAEREPSRSPPPLGLKPQAVARVSGSGSQLSETQCADFRRDGFLIVEGLSTPDELASLRLAYDRLFVDRRGWSKGDLFDMVGHDDLEKGLGLPQLLSPSRYEPSLSQTRLAANAAVIAGQLLGPKATNIFEHAILKPPRVGAATPWHQDDAFMRRGCGFDESIAIWMPLQDVIVDNGCMLYVRGSNHGPLHPHRSPKNDPRIHGLQTVTPPDLTHCMAAQIPAGGAVIHHSRTLHSAGINTSEQPRRAYVLGFAVQARPHKRFARDYGWNVEKATARDQREYQSLSFRKRIMWRIQRRMRGYS